MGDTDLPSDLDRLTLRVNELYDRRTVQGEGPHTGKLCTFVRTYGCNLHCRWCDTPFTWDTTGRNGVMFPREENVDVYDVEHICKHVRSLGVPICIISGGEPLLQAKAVVELATRLSASGIDTHVETNGTRPPPDDEGVIAHWSVSPKLPSADAGHNALLVPMLRLWAEHERAIFKIVCSTSDEVDQAHGIFELVRAEQRQRWIMPEGRSESAVVNSADAIVDRALERGMNISPRWHVTLWGDERGR